MELNKAVAEGKLEVVFNSNLLEIDEKSVMLSIGKEEKTVKRENNLVYIFAGGELPIQFLEKSGILITKKFGETVMKH